MIKNLKANIADWCVGRNGIVRIPFLIAFAYVFVHHLKDPMYRSILGPLNFGIHEVGHLLFSPFGEFMAIAGGTIFQLLTPIYGIFNFVKQDDRFSTILCLGWLSTNFYDVATYAGDARLMSLPLVSPVGGHVKHDWNYLLSQIGILQYDSLVAFVFRGFGFISMSICLGVGGWMIWKMCTANKHLITQ